MFYIGPSKTIHIDPIPYFQISNPRGLNLNQIVLQYALQPTSLGLNLKSWTQNLTPCILHPAPCTLHQYPKPYTLHPAPCTLHPAPCTLHQYPKPYVLHDAPCCTL